MPSLSSLCSGEKGTLKIPSKDGIMNSTSTLSNASVFRCVGMNQNHLTIPIVRNIVEQSLAEFLPSLWKEMENYTPSQKAIALKTYRMMQDKCRGVNA